MNRRNIKIRREFQYRKQDPYIGPEAILPAKNRTFEIQTRSNKFGSQDDKKSETIPC